MNNYENDMYILGGLGTVNVTIAFLPEAALDNTSVINVEIEKAGYAINGVMAIAVENNIPV